MTIRHAPASLAGEERSTAGGHDKGNGTPAGSTGSNGWKTETGNFQLGRNVTLSLGALILIIIVVAIIF
ncbi:MAG: hypothetical protein M3Q19_10880 [Pseudomonadota bacterium]|nr:hypothetical protein [Pseudomonadota bacterium]